MLGFLLTSLYSLFKLSHWAAYFYFVYTIYMLVASIFVSLPWAPVSTDPKRDSWFYARSNLFFPFLYGPSKCIQFLVIKISILFFFFHHISNISEICQLSFKIEPGYGKQFQPPSPISLTLSPQGVYNVNQSIITACLNPERLPPYLQLLSLFSLLTLILSTQSPFPPLGLCTSSYVCLKHTSSRLPPG